MFILLDIDGVMVPAAGWKVPQLLNDGFPDFSSKAVRGLNKIISATGSSILLTTSHKSKHSIASWKRIFTARGINAKISKLKNNSKFQSRKDEIIHWMETHPSEQNFVIIDDDKSLNDLPTPLKNKLILTSPLIGLNDELTDKAIEVLRQPLLLPA